MSCCWPIINYSTSFVINAREVCYLLHPFQHISTLLVLFDFVFCPFYETNYLKQCKECRPYLQSLFFPYKISITWICCTTGGRECSFLIIFVGIHKENVYHFPCTIVLKQYTAPIFTRQCKLHLKRLEGMRDFKSYQAKAGRFIFGTKQLLDFFSFVFG